MKYFSRPFQKIQRFDGLFHENFAHGFAKPDRLALATGQGNPGYVVQCSFAAAVHAAIINNIGDNS
jgi:hypothetical protein